MGWIVRLHNRLSIFTKVLVANAVIIAVGGIGGSLLAHNLTSAGKNPAELYVPFVGIGLLVSLGVNYGLLRLAFAPLFRLRQVMETIRAGNYRARAPRIEGDPDMTELAETFNTVLDALEEHQQSLSAMVLGALEEERRRISRELHDEAGQSLTTLVITLDMIEHALPEEQAALRERVSFARDTANRSLEEIRRIMVDLRPSVLDDLGLVPALRWYIKNKLQPLGLDVELKVEGQEGRLPDEVETSLFRSVQEALTNVLKHAGATRVDVRLQQSDNQIVAEVTDNGRGFLAANAHTRRPSRQGGFGLVGMQERVGLLGGRLEVHSQPGGGSTVHIVLPIRRPSSTGAG